MTGPLLITARTKSPVNLNTLEGRDDPTALPWAAEAVDLAELSAAAERTANKGQPGGYAELDGTGKIPTILLPTFSTGQVYIHANQAAMLAESGALVGAQSIREDLDRTFILTATPPATLANWHLLPVGTNVTSWNGQTGIVLVPEDGATGTPSLRTLGAGAQQAAPGNHGHAGSLDANARTRYSWDGATIGTRRALNLTAESDIDLEVTDEPGSERVNLVIRRTNILEGIPLVSLGHSHALAHAEHYGVGTGSGGASSQAACWADRVARRFGMKFDSDPFGILSDNRNVGNTTLHTTLRLALAAVWLGKAWNPGNYDAADRGVVAIDAVRNCAYYYGQNTGAPLTAYVPLFKDTLRSLLRLLAAAAGAVDITTAGGFDGTGPWSTTNDPAGTTTPTNYHGGSQIFTEVADARRVNIAASVGDKLVVMGAKVGVTTGVVGFTDFYRQSTFVGPSNPGPLLGTLATGGGLPVPDFAGETYGAMPYPTSAVIDVNAGESIVAMRRSGRSYLDCFFPLCSRTGNEFPPQVFVMHGGHVPNVPNASIDALNNAIDAVCAEAEFSPYCTATPLIGWDPNTCLHLDSHPNDRGQDVEASSLETMMRTIITDYTEGVHILA